jgi:hypothetical protein
LTQSFGSISGTPLRSSSTNVPGIKSSLALTGPRRRTNNLHFGQVLLKPDDLILFSTDGLGDVVDPLQIFDSPRTAQAFCELLDVEFCKPLKRLATTLESILNLPDIKEVDDQGDAQDEYIDEAMDDWYDFIKQTPKLAAKKIHMLKQLVLNIVLSSDVGSLDEKNEEQITAKVAVDRAITFSKSITRRSRSLYDDDPVYCLLQKDSKDVGFEKARNRFIRERKLPSLESLCPHLEDRLKFHQRQYLDLYTVPFAKMDHIALQCLKASVIDVDPQLNG